MEGRVAGWPRFGADAPTLMGNDQGILEFCLRKVGRWRRVWFAKDEELAGTCLQANANVLRLHSREHPWNICTNFQFVGCAARGQLPRQGSPRIDFATAPQDLWVRDLAAERTNGYRME